MRTHEWLPVLLALPLTEELARVDFDAADERYGAWLDDDEEV